MNVRMWQHPATQANLRTLIGRGVGTVGPTRATWPAASGAPAGWPSRRKFSARSRPLRAAAGWADAGRWSPADRRASRSTRCATSPTAPPAGRATPSPRRGAVRGRDHARLRADVARRSAGVTVVPIETAVEMLAACEAALPVDVAVCAALSAMAYRPAVATEAQEDGGRTGARTEFSENPDILATLSRSSNAGRSWSSASPPRRRASSRTPWPSAIARAATGSSPTTYRPLPGRSAANATPCT